MREPRDVPTLIVSALAAYRLTRLVTRDTLFQPWRELLLDRWPPNYERSRLRWVPEHQRHVMRGPDDHPKVVHAMKLLECPWCAGAWITALVLVVPFPRPVRSWLAMSAVVGFLGEADHALA